MMYLCLNCDNLFEDSRQYIDRHGLDSPPYEEYFGCPKCAGAYVETVRCDECDEWIIGEYIELKNGTVFCDQCYDIKDICDKF